MMYLAMSKLTLFRLLLFVAVDLCLLGLFIVPGLVFHIFGPSRTWQTCIQILVWPLF